MLSKARCILFTAACFMSACTQPVPGVLTLAPAGMRISGTNTPRPDGTLAMAADCIAESEVYVDAGTVTITVTASASMPDHALTLELWFAGTSVGSRRVQSTDPTALAFHSRASASGPVAIRLVVHADPPGSTAAGMLEVEKVVITEP